MAVVLLGTSTVADFTTTDTSFTVTGHTVTAGTDTLLMVWITRAFASGDDVNFSATWNGVALASLASNYTADTNFDDIVFWLGALNTPATGNQTAVLTPTGQQRGGTILLLNADGSDTADILGALQSQSTGASSTATASLSITPETTTGLAIAIFAISINTSLSSFSGAGYTVIDTGTSTGSNNMTRTIRSKASPASPETAGATFGAADSDIGGVLFEIRSSSTTFAASATIAGSAQVSTAGAVAGQGGGVSAGTAPRAPWFDGRSTWTSSLILQADDINVQRNMVRIGNPDTRRWSMQRNATGNGGAASVARCIAILDDGTIELESAANALTANPSVISWARQPGSQGITVDGVSAPPTLESNSALVGSTVLADEPIEVGTTAASITAYSGIMARFIVDGVFWSNERRRLFARALLRPEAVFGWGQTDARTDTNRSPIALPTYRTVGNSAATDIRPDTIDPDGTQPTLAAVGTPLHGTVARNGDFARYTPPTTAYIGPDEFTYQIDDGNKTSSSLVLLTVGTSPPPPPPPPPSPPPGPPPPPPPSPPPPPPPPGPPPPPPPPGQEFPNQTGVARNVSNNAEFRTAYSNWQPGDHIVLADGFNAALGTLDRSGTSANRIVIRAANNQKPTITGTPNFSGAYHFLWGVKVLNTSITLSGDNNTFRRVLFDGCPNRMIGDDTTGNNATFQYCKFSNTKGGGWRMKGHTFGYTFQFCHWLNIASSTSEEGTPLSIMTGWPTHQEDGHTLVEDCLYQNVITNPVAGGEIEITANKSARNVFRRVVLRDTPDKYVLNVRFGVQCRFESCRSINGGTFGVRGWGHIYNNCWGPFQLNAGDFDSSDHGALPNPPSGKTTWSQSAADSTFIGCHGAVEIGHRAQSQADTDKFPCKGIRFEAHSGTITKGDGQGNTSWVTTDNAQTEQIAADPPSYTAADVGVLAGL